MADNAPQQETTQEKSRNSKTATYLAAGGALSFAVTAFALPFSLPVLAVAAVTVALATNEKGRGFLKKVGQQLTEIGNDLVINVTEDVGRAQKWWNAFQAKRAEKKQATATVTAPAPEKPSTFKNASSKPGFETAAKPAGEAPAQEQTSAPAALPGQPPQRNPNSPPRR